MTNHILIGITAVLAIPLIACTREERQPEAPSGDSITLSLGFEQPTSTGPSAETKTYVLSDGHTVSWASTNNSGGGIEGRVYVFDSMGGKSTFNCGNKKRDAETVRPFSGTITEGSTVKYILWHGFSDNSILTETPQTSFGTDTVTAGGSASLITKSDLTHMKATFSGSCLTLPAEQSINNYHSFDNRCNFTVMREGDNCLKSVFGYIRYVIPTSRIDKKGTVKRIVLKADEYVAGQVELDYSGAEPIASVVAGGSKTLTVNSRWQTNNNKGPWYYEDGQHFAVLPVGKYHNVELKITTLPEGSYSDNKDIAHSRDDAATDSLTVYIRGEVVIERGKYTDLGTLPLSQTARSHEAVMPDSSAVHDFTYYDALFDTDYFEKFTDPGGVVSYRIKSDPIGWANSQSQYYNTKSMTNDERFCYFLVSENEFRPNYHMAAEKAAKILDLQTRQMYTFYANDGCYPYLDPDTDVIYYCLRSEDRKSARFYKRELRTAADVEVPLAEFTPQLVGLNDPEDLIQRVCSHITLTHPDANGHRSVFLDARVGDTFLQGLLNLNTGVWEEWSRNTNQLNLTHGQLNPVRDDEAIVVADGWTDKDGVDHLMSDLGIGYVNDGTHNGAGTYRRMNVLHRNGTLTCIHTHPDYNSATHEGWTPDGMHIYWCNGMKNHRHDDILNFDVPHDGGFHIRQVHNSPADSVVRQGTLVSRPVVRATHINVSEQNEYVVHDDDHKYRKWRYYYGEVMFPNYPAKEVLDSLTSEGYPYPTEKDFDDACYRGGPWRVWFYNMATHKEVIIYTHLPQITDKSHPSRIHPDPHPHFVCHDKYIVCTAYGFDGNLHWSITPVDQLITLSE